MLACKRACDASYSLCSVAVPASRHGRMREMLDALYAEFHEKLEALCTQLHEMLVGLMLQTTALDN